jgi:hypothetical protein
MDSRVWKKVYTTVRSLNRSVAKEGRRKQFSDVRIVGMHLWTVWHDRPLCWACDRTHYSTLFRPKTLPSVSQFCKRIKSTRCEQLLTKVYERLARVDARTFRCFLDARPLPVGPCSKDHQAKAGRVYGGFARGYKLHELAQDDGRTIVWSVMPLKAQRGPHPATSTRPCRTRLGQPVLLRRRIGTTPLVGANARTRATLGGR